jgi:hypothetical protein
MDGKQVCGHPETGSRCITVASEGFLTPRAPVGYFCREEVEILDKPEAL